MDALESQASFNIMKCYIAQMHSAMNIAEIVCKHSESNPEMDGDHVISGLVYRLMNPMSDEEMMSSLQKADNILKGEESEEEYSDDEDFTDDEEFTDDDDELQDIEAEFNKIPDSYRKLQRNNCNCDVCKRVRECLDGYKSYETYDPMVTKFKNGIKAACDKYKIII